MIPTTASGFLRPFLERSNFYEKLIGHGNARSAAGMMDDLWTNVREGTVEACLLL